MLKRVVVIVVGLFGILPASAEEMKPAEARRFVVGKTFSFTCFEGTRGAGRIRADGSVAGTIQFQGRGPVRYVGLPSNTLQVRGERVCASVRGLFFEPCFYLNKTSRRSFRGSLLGLSFAYCDFNSGRRRFEYARSRSRNPLGLRASHTGSVSTARRD
jgi:hypothetical protein